MTVSSTFHLIAHPGPPGMGNDLTVTVRIEQSLVNADTDLMFVTFRDPKNITSHVTLSGSPEQMVTLLFDASSLAQLAHERYDGERLDREDADHERAEEDALDQVRLNPIGGD